MIAGLLAIHAAALYVIWWLVMLVVRFVPIVGVTMTCSESPSDAWCR